MNDVPMDNQQEIVTEADKAWLGGIIDGEGCVAMNIRTKKWKGWNGIGVDLKLTVTNTDKGIVEKTKDVFTKLGVTPYIFVGTPTRNNKEVFHVGTSRMKSLSIVLKAVRPYLFGVKAKKADLMIKFIERRQGRQTDRSKGGYTWYDAYDWNLVEEFFALDGKELPKILRDYTPSQPNAA